MFEFHIKNLYTKIDKKKATKEEIDRISELLSVKVDGFWFSKMYQRGLWDGKHKFYNRLTGQFYTGLLGFIKTNLPDIPMVEIDERVHAAGNDNPLELGGGEGVKPWESRDYQVKAIFQAIQKKRGIIAMPTNSGKCLDGNSIIFLSDGTTKKVKNILPGDKILSLDEFLHQKEDIVEFAHSNGVKELFEIKTKKGKRLVATANHPILTGSGFRHLQELKVGELVGTVRKLDVLKTNFLDTEDFKLIFLGYHLSEGRYDKVVRFWNTDETILEEYKTAATTFHNTSVDVVIRKGVTCFRLKRKNKLEYVKEKTGCTAKRNRFGAIQLGSIPWNKGIYDPCDAQKFLDDCGLKGKDSKSKEFPEFVFSLPNEKIALLLNRYFCGDGWYSGASVGIGSASEVLVTQTAQLLLRFAIFGTIGKRIIDGKTYWSWSTSHNESLKNFISYIGIKSKKVNENRALSILAKRSLRNKHDRIPITRLDLKKLGTPLYRQDRPGSISSRKGYISRWLAKQCLMDNPPVKTLLSEYVLWDEIISIKSVGFGETYNLTTKTYHNFIADCIYTHNTEVACGIIKILGLPANFITHRRRLLWQTKRRFEARLGFEIGVIGDQERDIKDVNIISIHTLAKRLKEDKQKEIYADPEIKALMAQTPVVFSDECHHISADSWERCLKACTGAYYRFGLSATALMRDSISNMTVLGLTGDEIITVSDQELTDAGISAFPAVFLKHIDLPKFKPHTPYDVVYEEGVMFNEQQNKFIVDTVRKWTSIGKSVFVVVFRIHHGERLQQMIGDAGIKTEFIYGGDQSKSRLKNNDDVLDRFADKSLPCIVSSNISDEGLDVPAIDVMVIAVGDESALKVVQRVGRGRRQKEGENIVIIVDFIHTNSPYLKKHSKSRLKQYEKMGLKLYEVRDWDNVVELC